MPTQRALKREQIELYPDAIERLERAIRVIAKARPMPSPAKQPRTKRQRLGRTRHA
jgi:hypothetical protein